MKNLKSSFLLFAIVTMMLGVVCFPSEVQAATSGQFSCSSGSVTWELDNEGVLTFSGSGSMLYVNWYGYWSNAGLDTTAVSVVKVKEGSEIKLQNCNYMFRGFENCQKMDLTGMDTSQVTNMSWMFDWCRKLTELNISGMDTSRVTDMSGMFSSCAKLEKLDVTGFDTSQVTDMGGLFSGCHSLEKLDVTGFDTSKVTDMASMFWECYMLEELDVTGFDTGKVTNMTCMFMDCYCLTELDVTGFDTSKVTNMSSMFRGCSGLTELNVTGFDTGKVASMSYMFQKCLRLTGLDVTGFNTGNVVDMSYMFDCCRSLGKLDLSNFDMSKVTSKDQFLGYSNTEDWALECLITPRNVTGLILPKGKGAMWIDNAKNYYDEAGQYTFSQITTLYNIKETYSIRHNYMEDGTLVGCQTQYGVKQGLSTLGNVVHQHATFNGWYLDADYTQPITVIEPGTYGDITLYAQMIPDVYDITYSNIEDISNPNALMYEYAYGSECVLPSPSKTDYNFEGWYTDEECTKQFSAITKEMTGDLILYAKWSHECVPVLKNTVQSTCTAEGYTGDKYCRICNILLEKGSVVDKKEHKVGVIDALPATCCSVGYTGNQCCEVCHLEISKGTEIPMLDHDIDRANGTIVKAATEMEIGTMAYKCKNCTYTITEEIPRLKVEDEVLASKNDDDVKGSTFALLQAKEDKTTKKSIRLKWTKVKGADGYLIYGNKCGKKNRYELVKTIKNGKKTSYTMKKLKKGTYYKYIIRAYKEVDGQKISIAVSKTVHATTTGGKYGNAKSVKVKTDKKLKQNKKTKQYTLTIKKNKKYTIKASEVKSTKKINIHRKIAFESSNPKIATVNKKGVVKGRKKGTCYVYAYAQNGVFQKIKVKIK